MTINEADKQYFMDNINPAYKMSESEEFKSFSKEEQLNVLLIELDKQQQIELTDFLHSNNYTAYKETQLKKKHSKNRNKLYSQFYKEDTTSQIEKIQAKNNITIKEFVEIYNISKTSQQSYRSRLYDSLPYHQKVEGGKIVYVVEEVENWFANQHK